MATTVPAKTTVTTTTTKTTTTTVPTKVVKPIPGWVRGVRWAFFVASILFLLGVLVQSYLAGAFILGGQSSEPHIGLGFMVGHGLALVVLILALLSRLGLRLTLIAVANFLVSAVFPILPGMREDVPALAAAHPLGAVLVFGITYYVVTKVWPMVKAAPSVDAPATPSPAPVRA